MTTDINNLKTITLDQMMVIGSYDLSTFDGKMRAISKALETLDMPTEEDKERIFQVVTEGVYAPDTGKFFVNTTEPLEDRDGFVYKYFFTNPETGQPEPAFGVEPLEEATAFTKEELDKLPKKLRVYNCEPFVMPEYIARYKYDLSETKENYKSWLNELISEHTVNGEELEKEQQKETEEKPKNMITSFGRARG